MVILHLSYVALVICNSWIWSTALPNNGQDDNITTLVDDMFTPILFRHTPTCVSPFHLSPFHITKDKFDWIVPLLLPLSLNPRTWYCPVTLTVNCPLVHLLLWGPVLLHTPPLRLPF